MLTKSKIQQYYYNGIVNRIDAVKNLYKLKKEFNVIVPLDKLYTGKDEILQICITNLSHGKRSFHKIM